MEQIIANLKDIEWWFTGIFFIFLSWFLSKLCKYFWIKLNQIKFHCVSLLYKRRQKAILQRVKNYRQEDLWIVWLIVKYWSFFLIEIMFRIILIMYFILVPVSESKYVIIFVVIITVFFEWYNNKELEVIRKIMQANKQWKRRKR